MQYMILTNDFNICYLLILVLHLTIITTYMQLFDKSVVNMQGCIMSTDKNGIHTLKVSVLVLGVGDL